MLVKKGSNDVAFADEGYSHVSGKLVLEIKGDEGAYLYGESAGEVW